MGPIACPWAAGRRHGASEDPCQLTMLVWTWHSKLLQVLSLVAHRYRYRYRWSTLGLVGVEWLCGCGSRAVKVEGGA